MEQEVRVTRRRVIEWGCAPLAAAIVPALPGAALAAANDTLTVLYRRNTVDGPTRLDPAVQAATSKLQDEFVRKGYRVVQPSAGTYALLDLGPAVVLSFAPDAGFSMVFAANKSIRPVPGTDLILAEVILTCNVFVGYRLLVGEEARGIKQALAEADIGEFASRRSAELAAQAAAIDLAAKVAARLSTLSPADVEQMTQLKPPIGQYVPLPLQPAPPPPVPQPIVAAPPAPTLPAPAPVAVTSPPSPANSPAAPVVPSPAPAAAPAAQGGWSAPARRFALVVAVSDYGAVRERLNNPKEPKSLQGVAQDRVHLVDGLKERGFAPENIRVLADRTATSAAVRDAMRRLLNDAQPDDLALIAISAHGAPAEQIPSGFGLPILSDFSMPSSGLLDFWELQSLVGNLRARSTVLVLDTCHAGGAAEMMRSVFISREVRAGANDGPDATRMAEAQKNSGRAFAVLASSTADQSSGDTPTGGVFTNSFLAALRASDRNTTLADLFERKIKQSVMAGTQQKQTPVFAYSGRGNEIVL